MFLHALSRAMFPLNLSSSLVRLIVRLPSLFFLSKSLLLWSTILAQIAHYDSPCFHWLASWVPQHDTAPLCWFTFCSVCGALCVDALTRGLEGTNSNASPFNLVCPPAAWPYQLSPRLFTHHHNLLVRLCISITHILIPNDTRHKTARSPITSR